MIKLLIGTASVALLLSVPVVAQPAPPPPGVDQGTTPMRMSSPHSPPIIRSPVPVRAEGRVMTRDDVVNHVRELFAKLDLNHDGFITKDELAAFHQRMGAMQRNSAENDGRGVRPATRRRMAMTDPGKMFDQLDTNHDGVISRQEFMAAHAGMEERQSSMMAGADMTARQPSMGPMMGHMRGMGDHHGAGFFDRLFAMADSNHDGRVSLQEAQAAALAHFDKMDLNHDGRVTPDERRQAHAMMHGQQPR